MVALEVLLRAAFHAAIDVFFLAGIGGIITFEHEEVLLVCNHLRIDGVECTATER